MAERIFNVEHDREQGVITFSIKRPRRVVSSAAKGHFRTAKKETLLAFRNLIDDAISTIEREEEKGSKKRTNIDIE